MYAKVAVAAVVDNTFGGQQVLPMQIAVTDRLDGSDSCSSGTAHQA